MTLSPYALLKAAKPKQPKSVTTQYDQFSLSQKNSSGTAPVDLEHHPVNPGLSTPAVPPMPLPPKRTHYISDIHARHTGASRVAHQQPGSL